MHKGRPAPLLCLSELVNASATRTHTHTHALSRHISTHSTHARNNAHTPTHTFTTHAHPRTDPHMQAHTHTEKPTAAGPRNASGGMMLGDADAGMRGGCWPFAASLPLLPLGLMLPSANASDACFSS